MNILRPALDMGKIGQLKPRLLAGLIILTFTLLAGAYSVATPIFEAPDELWHYPFVWHLARTWELPVQDPANPQLWRQEGGQAPLYYALAALITSPIPTDDLPALIYPNPHADIGLVRPDGNANIVVHTEREAWPWRGAVLAIHLARFFSVLLGAGTGLTIYALGRTLWPANPLFALLAMAFVAFNPMFLFIAGSVNNDNLIILLASLAVWWLVKLVTSYPAGQRGSSPQPTAEPSLWHFIGLGSLVGLAALAKASGLLLLGLVGLTLLWWGGRRRSWTIALLGNSLVSLLAVTVAGWWYWRNWVLYGDLTGTENFVILMGPRPFPPTPGQLLAELPGLLRSFWGLFGYFSVPLPLPLYWLFNLILLAGLAGLLLALWPGKRSRFPPVLNQSWPILAAWLLLTAIALIQWTLRAPATQGRFLFPTFSSLAIFWAAGWMALIPARWQWLPVPLMLAVAIWAPWGVIAPAYARPAPLATLPASAHPLKATFGDTAQLLGYEYGPSPVRVGETTPVTLYWRSDKPMADDYTLFIHLLDENDLIIAQRNLFHGPGVYPTSRWAAGQPFADRYELSIPRTAFAPVQAQFEVGLYDHTTGRRLSVSTGGDSLRFGAIKVQPRPGELPNPQLLQFEDNIALVGYNLDRRLIAAGQQVKLTLYWQSQDRPSGDYKIFTHLVGQAENRAAQHDSAPQNGNAPTSGWTPGQLVVDQHPLVTASDTPPGPYRLVIGLYQADTGRRLRLLYNDDRPVQADSITLAGIRIR